jgi:ParB family chromosome partitioning protein
MNKDDQPRKALGKGLSALLPARAVAPTRHPQPQEPEKPAEPPQNLAIDFIDPNPLQPRSVFEPGRLEELAQSIRANGIIQPLIVRRAAGRYQLVAGERRWRAARLAGLTDVPVVVRDFEDERLLEITLIENIQREDLNPIEVAHAYDRLGRELALTHDDIARRTGKDRSSITNTLRLLKLPVDVQNLLADRRLSMGHARAILGLPTPELQMQVAEKTSAQNLSVRQVERLVQRMTETREPKTVAQVEEDPNVKAAVEEMERALGTRVRVVHKSENRGRIEIEYYSQDDLDRIYQAIVGAA